MAKKVVVGLTSFTLFWFRSISSLLVIVLLLLLYPSPSTAKPYQNSTTFDGGYFGAYPYQTYTSSSLVSPRLNILQWDRQCDNAYILFTPRAGSVPKDTAMILDSNGSLVWANSSFGTADNLQIQTYKGEQFLTFWAGDHHVSRWPGYYYMLDSSYRTRYVVAPVGFEYGDLHEFKILDTGNALMTIYEPLRWDLSSMGGPENGWILDCHFQEVELQSGALVFEWRSSDHYNPTDTFAPIGHSGKTAHDAFDYFHLNSIDKDPHGNYYISGRLVCLFAYISGTNGSVLWEVGGRRSSFKDLSSGAATNFTYQHHIQYHGLDPHEPSNASVLVSLFDNAKFQRHPTPAYQSRGLLLSLNLVERTATLVQDFTKPMRTLSHSQGSMQLITSPDTSIRESNALVGWGHEPAWTMFDSRGRVLCDVHFGAYSMWNLGWAVSYRVFQFNKASWVGRPVRRPDIAVRTIKEGTLVFASWNGATEIRMWRLQGDVRWKSNLETDDEAWMDIHDIPKDEFEVVFTVSALRGERAGQDGGREVPEFRFFRVQALAEDGQVLGTTLPINARTQAVYDPSSPPPGGLTDSTMVPFLFACGVFSVVLTVFTILIGNRRQAYPQDAKPLLLHRVFA